MPCQYCFDHALPCTYPELLQARPAPNPWYGYLSPSGQYVECVSPAFTYRKECESRQQQIETRLSRIETSLATILETLNGFAGVLQQPAKDMEPSLVLDPYPPKNACSSSTPSCAVNGENKVAFPPLPSHTMNAVRSALRSSGVLLESDVIQVHELPQMCGRRAPVQPIPELQSSIREIHALGLDTVSRLVDEFHEECFPLYPAVDMTKVKDQVYSLFSSPGLCGDRSVSPLSLWDLNMLKTIIAIEMQYSDDLQCPLKYDLLSHISWDTRLRVSQDTSTIEDIQISTLIVSTKAHLCMQAPASQSC